MNRSNPVASIEVLEATVRALGPLVNSGATSLYQARTDRDTHLEDGLLRVLANLIGLGYVAAQTVLVESRAAGKLLERSDTLVGHPWLKEMEFVNAVANFWKHQSDWSSAAWDVAEEATPRQSRSLQRLPAELRTAEELAGMGLRRIRGAQGIKILADKFDFEDLHFDGLLKRVRAWSS